MVGSDRVVRYQGGQRLSELIEGALDAKAANVWNVDRLVSRHGEIWFGKPISIGVLEPT